VLRKLEKLADRASFDITTKETIASVRGTSFCVWADSTSTYVCACNGAVHTVDSVGGNPLDLASAHHLARIYSVKDGTVTVAEGTLLHHDDASVQSAASRIGYTIDWTKQD
jgi:ferric-dicitrate binding protein FerR (iron transport regulator)